LVKVFVFSCPKHIESNDYARQDFRLLIQDSLIEFVEVDFNKSDQEIAGIVHDYRITVLFDVNGGTGDGKQGVFAYKPANFNVLYLAFAGTSYGKHNDAVVCDNYVFPEIDANRTHEQRLVVSCYQGNSYAERFSERPFEYANAHFARMQEGIPLDCTFVFCCFASLKKLTLGVLIIWLKVLENNPKSCLWLYSEPVNARNRIIEIVKARNPELELRLIWAGQISKNAHLIRHELADVSFSPVPYGSHTTAGDSIWSMVPVFSMFIPSDETNLFRWAYNVSASVVNRALGDDSHFVNLSFLEQSSKADFFAKNPQNLQPYRVMLKNLRNQRGGSFDMDVHAEELMLALNKFLVARRAESPEHSGGGGGPSVSESTKSFDGRLSLVLPAPVDPLIIDTGMTRIFSKRLGALERIAESISEQNTDHGRDDISVFDTARVVFELVATFGSFAGDLCCFVDASLQQQMVMSLLAKSMKFKQAFTFFDLKSLKAYWNNVKPRLDRKQLEDSDIGAAFVDFKSAPGAPGAVPPGAPGPGGQPLVLWPRNMQCVLLSALSEEGKRIFDDLASWVFTNSQSSQIQACAVIEHRGIDPSCSLGVLNKDRRTAAARDPAATAEALRRPLRRRGPAAASAALPTPWRLFKIFNVLKQNQHGELQVQIFIRQRHGDAPCWDIRRTMALQSDLLLAIIGSKSKVGKQLRMELNEGTQCDREDALDLSVWNLVSLCVVSSAPELRIVGLLGEGGFGIVIR
jgi:hypothetical protein